jgi:REP element-mobilizing transposase RayT
VAVPQSLARILIHLIFGIKDRAAVLAPSVRPELRAYFVGILSNLECPCLEVGCVADHAHVLFVLHRTLSAAAVVEEVKKGSSKWLKTRGPAMRSFHWQNGYGAFSVSPSNEAGVRAYILAQEEHHRKVTFQDEFRDFLRRHGVAFDERYVWD